MKLSARGHYGLIAMAYLAQREQEGSIPIKTIATAEHIPDQFLEQILASMRKAGLVTAVRGPNGGYKLSRPANQIKVGEIINALEGAIAPVDCLHTDDDQQDCCVKTDSCTTKFVWEKLRDTMVSVLDNITLRDIVERGNSLIGEL